MNASKWEKLSSHGGWVGQIFNISFFLILVNILRSVRSKWEIN